MIREVTDMNKHELYHNHNYVYLLTSNIINRCGDSLDTILFTWLVYLLTNSASCGHGSGSADAGFGKRRMFFI